MSYINARCALGARANSPLVQGAGNVPLHHVPRASVTPFPLPDARTASDFCAAFTCRGAGMRKSGLPRGNEFPLQRDKIEFLTLVVRLGRATSRRYFERLCRSCRDFKLPYSKIVAAIHTGELACATNCVALNGGINPPCARNYFKC